MTSINTRLIFEPRQPLDEQMKIPRPLAGAWLSNKICLAVCSDLLTRLADSVDYDSAARANRPVAFGRRVRGRLGIIGWLAFGRFPAVTISPMPQRNLALLRDGQFCSGPLSPLPLRS